ncbi:MAG: DNA adenine methylase [Armatimonadetes bacterium]|nr:DNA adenine methylase [Armatimonadota bacterium]
MIKSPLRYPGGKSRGIAEIAARFPTRFDEYREPMVGGGSVFCHVRQAFPEVQCWINDLNHDLVYFWQATQADADALATELHRIRDTEPDGRALFDRLKATDKETMSPFERATRFFVLNRITFSGTIEAGGYSQGAFAGRFTHSAIERVRALSPLLAGVRITHGDYAPLLFGEGESVFVFLDPPYLTATSSKLYGAKGHLHTGFDHERFAELLAKCPHNYLVTYDDAPVLRERFAAEHLHGWSLQYGMNNYKQAGAAIGAELMISSYAPEGITTVPLPETNPKRAQFALALETKLPYPACEPSP